MQFDFQYFCTMIQYINDDAGDTFITGAIYKIEDWSSDPDKMLFHLMYYMDATCNAPHKGWRHIELIDLTEQEIQEGKNYHSFRVLPLSEFSEKEKFVVQHTTESKGVIEFLSKHPYREYVFDLPF